MTKTTDVGDYDEIREELSNATDRSLTILASAYVENALSDRLLWWLGSLGCNSGGEIGATTIAQNVQTYEKKIIKDLSGNGGPLGTFSNKIMLARALNLIGPKTKKDLGIIKSIRNTAAHSTKNFSFLELSISDQCADLSARQLPIQGDVAWLPPRTEPRKRFEECCHQIYDQLYNDPRDPLIKDISIIEFGFSLN